MTARTNLINKETLFELSRVGASGEAVTDQDFNPADFNLEAHFTGLPLKQAPLGLPELTEVEVVRHYTNLSRDNFGVDNGSYPLGSCTMKYNPKRNDEYANYAGFREIHPMQPDHSYQGLLQLLFELQHHIGELTGMDAVSLQPAAGAHGELAGLYIAKKYFETKNENRDIILVADSAHGTNPSSAAMAGYHCEIIPTNPEGLMNLDVLREKLNPRVAGLMLTNPSTLGVFEENIQEITKLCHENGTLLYYDGANLNALMGIVRPGDMGFDIIHINAHKTLSTPHGGGGPGAGPIGVKDFLKDYMPIPVVEKKGDKYHLNFDLPLSIGRIKAFYGHMSVMIRAYAYILAMGPEGLKQATENAVLNANYLQYKLRDIMPPIFNKLCMHECLLSGTKLSKSIFDFARELIKLKVHPPTLVGAGCVYFPPYIKSAMLIEPTETETKQSLDNMIAMFEEINAKEGTTTQVACHHEEFTVGTA